MANNNLVTQITIRAGVEGINDINRLADAIEEAGTDVGQLRQSAMQLQNAWRSLSTDEQTRQLHALSDEAERLRNLTNARLTLNLTGDDQVRRQIQQVTQAYQTLRTSGTLTTAELNRATQAYQQQLRTLQAQLNHTTHAQNALSYSTQGVQQALTGLQGLMAGLGLTVGLAEITQMSDEFNSLEARIKLATGEGLNFTNAMASIRAIADETQLPLTSTGELFGKLTGATKDLGLAQSEVLDITKTINQAMAVSGGSAQSMDAAITQLAQGLSAGALRGDEFNSVVEQSPRLAAAMADGLGVTIGKLREMAGEGKLTAQVVVEALKSQSDTIAKEFSQMPATVSGSLTVLKNTVLGFVGDMDNELNSSAGLAGFITSISDGIKNIDPANIEALKNALGSLGEIAHTLWTQLTFTVETVQDLIHAFTGVSSANEQVSFLTRTVQGLAIATGTVADGFKAIQIVIQTVMGFVTEQIGKVVYAFNVITGKGGQLADDLMKKGQEMLASAKQNALEFSSSAKAALDDAAKTNQQRLQETANKARQAYEAMAKDGKASADKLQSAFADYAQKAIQANGNVIDDTLKRQLAEHKLQATISQTGQVAIDSLAKQSDAIKQTTYDLQNYQDSFKQLNIDMGVFAGGLPTKVNDTLHAFGEISQVAGSNVKQLAMAYNAATTAIGEHKAGQEALNASLLKAAGGSQELADKIKKLANEQKYASGAASEQTKALEALGVSMTAINHGLSNSGKKMVDNLTMGLSAIKAQAKGANELKTALAQALDTSLAAAQTQADFVAIKQAVDEAGLTASVSAKHLALLHTGATGSSAAVQELTQHTNKHSQAVADNSKHIAYNTRAKQDNAKAHANIIHAQKAQQDSQKATTQGSSQTAKALRIEQQGLQGLSLSYQKLQQIQEAYWAMLKGKPGLAYNEAFARMLATQEQETSAFRQLIGQIQHMNQSLEAAAVSTKTLTEAQTLLNKASTATLAGIKAVDEATLNKLQQQITNAKNRLHGLSDTAKQTVDELQSELARLQGDELTVLKMQQARQLHELTQKLQEAKHRNNAEEIAHYEHALRLQERIHHLQTQELQNAPKADTKTAFNKQTATHAQNPTLSSSDVIKAWQSALTQAKQEAKDEAKQELLQELVEGAKRRAR